MSTTTTLILTGIAVAVIVGGIIFARFGENGDADSAPVEPWTIHQPEPKLLRLHRRDEDTIEGIFLGFESGHYRLVNAKLLHDDETRTVLDGETWVPRGDVLLAQVIT